MSVDLVLPVSIAFALTTWTLIFVWYVHPFARRFPMEKVLEPILVLHAFRYVGLMFLVPGVTTEPLDPRFADPAAYGDLIAAMLAVGALAMFRLRLPWRVGAVWLFNVWGLGDLLNAVARGLMYTPDGHLGATYWIPATIVPMLLITHVYVFYLLAAAFRAGSARLKLRQGWSTRLP